MEQYLPALRAAALFNGMDDNRILSILRCMDARVAQRRKDEPLLRAGERAQCMGVLLTGSALIVQADVWGRRNIMAKLTPGESFAEPFAAAGGAALNISVVPGEACEVLWLDINRTLTLCPSACEHHARVVRNLVSVLAKKALKFNEKITHMSRRTTREKLLSYLSGESMRQGALNFDIPYDRQQLADYLCVDRSAMCVELSRLQREGVLTAVRRHFTLRADALPPKDFLL